ncbi:hypothetical protein JW916_04550 [Candidatus Sumerlaeota bacterium]|nr:hypothetical protein [Candidatus Sumerlaeota bacterium]
MTLIELLIVVSILAMCGGGIVTVSVQMMREHKAAYRRGEMRSRACLTMEALVRDLTRASAVSLSESKASEDGETRLSMVLDRSSGGASPGAPTRVDYLVIGDRVERRIATPLRTTTQVLCSRGGALAVERRGQLLRVDIACEAEGEETLRMAADFYVGGRFR